MNIYKLKEVRKILSNLRKIDWENDQSRVGLFNFTPDTDSLETAPTVTAIQYPDRNTAAANCSHQDSF